MGMEKLWRVVVRREGNYQECWIKRVIVIMSIIYRLLLTFNATSLILVIFFVKERWRVIDIIKLFTNKGKIYNIFDCISENLSFFIYCLVPVILTFISLRVSKYLGHSNIKKGSITEIENVNNAFLLH